MITWNILRAAGIGAYVMLFLSVALALMGTTSVSNGRPTRQTFTAVHQFLPTVAMVLLGIHLGGLLLDEFMNFRPLDLLVPLQSAYKPWAVAGGIFAMYAMVFIMVAAWVRRGLPAKVWRATHLVSVPAFILAMLHGIFAGTDTARPIMWGLYLATGLTVLFLVLVRALTTKSGDGWVADRPPVFAVGEEPPVPSRIPRAA